MAPRKRHKYKPRVRFDSTYQQISLELAEKGRRDKGPVIEEMYVDSQRSVAVSLGGPNCDLKEAIDQSGLSLFSGEPTAGAPSDTMYLKQGEHLMKKGVYAAALYYLNMALKLNPESKLAQAMKAKCHLKMGNWPLALESAQQVLDVDKNFVKAIYVKAESLYNTCDFEHALINYHRGQRLSPDMEEFRLGVQKCRKTIKDGIKNDDVFRGEGIDVIFKFFRKTSDLRSGEGAGTIRSVRKNLEVITEESKLDELLRALEVVEGKKPKKPAAPGFWPMAAPAPAPAPKLEPIPEKKLASKKPIDPELEEKIRRVRARCAAKAKIALSGDRLLEDKLYLTVLANAFEEQAGLRIDVVQRNISNTAVQALEFLKAREEFWNQLQLGHFQATVIKSDKSSKTQYKLRF